MREEAVFDLQLSLAERQNQFLKFCLVILDCDQTRREFSDAFENGYKESREPLYHAFSELRRAAEVTEEEAFDTVLASVIPRGLQRPPRTGSKYPDGPGR